MLGAKRSKNQSGGNYFLAAYYQMVIIAFLIAFGGALSIVLIQLGTRGVIEVSFAQIGGKLESSASVPSNPTNSLNEKLWQKETELQRKESYLAEVVIANEARFLAYLFSISGALFLLILLNFFFDYQRRKFHDE